MKIQEAKSIVEKVLNHQYSSKLSLFEGDGDFYEIVEPNLDGIIENTNQIGFKLHGGLNGGGDWKGYFKDLYDFVNEIENRGAKIWLIDLWNDALDDVFDIEFGICFPKDIR